MYLKTVIAAAAAAILATTAAQAQQMSFFVTSVSPGTGADLGGLAGADAHCQKLARSVGAGKRVWHAYLSQQAVDGFPAVNARDRIGRGPWFNAEGVLIAENVYWLHTEPNLTKSTALDEHGAAINGRGDGVNRHDALTGTLPDGSAPPPDADKTCRNWTSRTAGIAIVGHIDRQGLRDDAASRSWNSSHPSRGKDGGCSQADLRSTGGDALLYCFAVR